MVNGGGAGLGSGDQGSVCIQHKLNVTQSNDPQPAAPHTELGTGWGHSPQLSAQRAG